MYKAEMPPHTQKCPHIHRNAPHTQKCPPTYTPRTFTHVHIHVTHVSASVWKSTITHWLSELMGFKHVNLSKSSIKAEFVKKVQHK